MKFSCSCPDWASMCKHVAAVLYGVGARLDRQPELLFRLRRVDAKDLFGQAGAGLPKSKNGPAACKVLDGALLADVFGIEVDEPVAPKKKPAPAKKLAIRSKARSGKLPAAKAKGAATAPATKKPVRAASAAKPAQAKPAERPISSRKRPVAVRTK